MRETSRIGWKNENQLLFLVLSVFFLIFCSPLPNTFESSDPNPSIQFRDFEETSFCEKGKRTRKKEKKKTFVPFRGYKRWRIAFHQHSKSLQNKPKATKRKRKRKKNNLCSISVLFFQIRKFVACKLRMCHHSCSNLHPIQRNFSMSIIWNRKIEPTLRKKKKSFLVTGRNVDTQRSPFCHCRIELAQIGWRIPDRLFLNYLFLDWFFVFSRGRKSDGLSQTVQHKLIALTSLWQIVQHVSNFCKKQNSVTIETKKKKRRKEHRHVPLLFLRISTNHPSRLQSENCVSNEPNHLNVSICLFPFLFSSVTKLPIPHQNSNSKGKRNAV